jgi:hypothetical protein
VFSFLFFPVTEFNFITSIVALINYFIRVNIYHSAFGAETLEVSAPDGNPAIDTLAFLLVMAADMAMLATYKLKIEVDQRNFLMLEYKTGKD